VLQLTVTYAAVTDNYSRRRAADSSRSDLDAASDTTERAMVLRVFSRSLPRPDTAAYAGLIAAALDNDDVTRVCKWIL